MKNFKYILISSGIIFVFHFIAHFIFDIFQNDIIAVFFPTNESTFQHLKMIYTCFFLFYFILFIIRRKLHFENIFLSGLVSVVSCIGLFLIIYLPVFFRFGEHMIFTFILLLISICFGQTIGSLFLVKKDYKQIEIISIILFSILFIIFGYLTYHPIENFLFWDSKHETYERVLK